MERKYLLSILFLVVSYVGFSQIQCPSTIKTSGQSSPESPILTVPNGQNGCAESWPNQIIVNGSLVYEFVSCQGGNLEYVLVTGTAPSTFEMTMDFGGGIMCSYDASGNLNTLSDSDFKKPKISVTPNPTNDVVNISLNSNDIINNIELYTITGKLVLNKQINIPINISEFNTGIYILKIETDNGILTKKIVKN